MPSRSVAACAVSAALLVGSCAIQDNYSQDYLRPDKDWGAEPQDLGLTAIQADIAVSGANIHGFLIPSDRAKGRTVVLFHGSGTNASQLFPYYSFLHEAGFNVFAFDYRGFGQSLGEASMHGTINDMPAVLDWLQQRPEVDRQQLALYGLGFGATVALNCAVKLVDARAIVLEGLQSPRDNIHDAIEQKHGEVSAMFASGMAEFSSIPDGLEPDANAEELKAPALFLGGAELPRADLKAMLRSYLRAKGQKQLWIMADTGAVPEALATQAGQYQQTVVAFLQAAFAGAPGGVSAECKPGTAGKDGVWCEVTLTRGDSADANPWAVEVCGVDEEGATTFQRVWLEGAQGTFKLRFQQQPTLVTAARRFDVIGSEDGSWLPAPDTLAASMRVYNQLLPDLELLRHGEPDAAQVEAFASKLSTLRQQQPFDPRLDAELADVYYQLGHRLLQSGAVGAAEAGRFWLQLAVDSAPQEPKLHCWPARNPTFGYPQQPAVDAARAQLASLPK